MAANVPWSPLDNKVLVSNGVISMDVEGGMIHTSKNGVVKITRAKLREERFKFKDVLLKFINKNEASALGLGFQVEMQAAFCRTIRERYLVHVYNVIHTQRWLWIPMEPMEMNLVEAKSMMGGKGMSEERCRTWFSMILDALRYMHHKGWTHRNIRPSSILFDEWLERVVLGGFSQVFQVKRGHTLEDNPESDVYFKGCGPRRLEGSPYDPYAEDVYALGMLIFTTIADNCILNDADDDIDTSLLTSYLNTQFRHEVNASNLSKEGKELVLNMTSLSESDRPKVRDIIKSAWVTSTINPKSPYVQWPHNRPGSEFAKTFKPPGSTGWDEKNITFPKKIEAAGYRVEHKIGAGGFGSVYKAWKGKQPMACKVIDIQQITKHSPRHAKRYRRELEIIQSYNHPNICKVYDIFIERNRHGYKKTQKDGEDRKIFIFMELCLNDLNHVCRFNHGKRLHDVHARIYLLGVAKGLNYLHMMRVAHRDMKMDNILVRSKTEACVTDFSFAKETPRTVPADTFLGTMKYRSPEILAEDRPYDPYAADVWAYGLCIVSSVTGKHLFQTNGQANQRLMRELVKKTDQLIAAAEISDQARDLVYKCMQFRERDRIPFATVINHEWFHTQREKLTYKTWQEQAGTPPDPRIPPPPLFLQ